MPHATSISSFLTCHHYECTWWKLRTIHAASHLQFSPPPPTSSVLSPSIFPVPHSRTPLLWVYPLTWKVRLHTHKKQEAKLRVLCFLISDGNTKYFAPNYQSILRISFPFNLLLNAILICCCYDQIFELVNISKDSFTVLVTAILSCILLMNHTYRVFQKELYNFESV